MEARLLARDVDDYRLRDRSDDLDPRCRVAALLLRDLAEGAEEPARTALMFDDLGRVVRDLMIDGKAAATVQVAGQTKTVSFSYEDMFLGAGRFTHVGTVTSVAEALTRVPKSAAQAGIIQYVETLLASIEQGLGLPLWMLDPTRVSTANVVAIKWALVAFMGVCDRYRHAMRHDVQQALGVPVDWITSLRGDPDAPGLLEYANVYAAFCDGLGLELTPLRTEVIEGMKILRSINVITAAEQERIAAAFPRCGST